MNRCPRRWSILNRSLPFLVLCTLAAEAFCDSEWPSFRGHNAQGVAATTTTVGSWNMETGENVLWKTPIPGLGHSSPVIAGDRLFVTTALNGQKKSPLKVGLYGDPESADDNEPQKWQVYCLDSRGGKILWQATANEGVPRFQRHPKATHANCTIATDGTHVVAFFGSEGLYCYDLAGSLRWKKDFGTLRSHPMIYNDKPFQDGLALQWGFASSPVISGGRVFVQCDAVTNGFVGAFDLADGREVWRTPRKDTATWSTPTVCVWESRSQLVVNGYSHMGGYDLRTGQELWRLASGGDCPVPTPVVWKDLIFLMSSHGPRSPIYAVKTSARGDITLQGDARTNEFVAWSVKKGGAYMQTPLVYGDCLYTCQDNGSLSCYEATTGKMLYRERLGFGGEGFTASPVASKEKLYFTGEEGTVFVVKPGSAWSVISTNHMNEVCMATPAIADGKLFFRTQGHLVSIGIKPTQ